MYYLQSRYYDANICRFINADSALYHSMLGYNLFVYCENAPVGKIDITGQYCVDIMDDDGNPLDDWIIEGASGGGAKAGYYGPGTAYYNYQVRMGTAAYDARLGGYHSLGLSSAMINPNYYCVSGAVTVTDIMATNRGTVKIKSNNTSVHGNSLKSTKTNYGYALVDSNGNILKFGETINPSTRYSKSYLLKNDAKMVILTSGSKLDIHLWQHDMNEYYYYKYGEYPPLNKRGW